MTEIVVHVTTLEQWQSVLDVWFKQGYDWGNSIGYEEGHFYDGSRQLGLNVWGCNEISYWSNNDYNGDNLIEYSDFMSQQEKTMAKETYYVTQEQIDLIEKLKSCLYPLHILVMDDGYKVMNFSFSEKEEKALLRYLGGDTSIEFKVKEQLYLLKRTTFRFGPIYFNKMGDTEENDYCFKKSNAFTAPLEEIKKWKTPAWEIEEVK